VRELAGEDASDACEVWQKNRRTLEVFLSLSPRWDIAIGWSAIAWCGIPRHEIEATLRMMLIPRKEHAELLADLRAMEAAALEILNAKRD